MPTPDSLVEVCLFLMMQRWVDPSSSEDKPWMVERVKLVQALCTRTEIGHEIHTEAVTKTLFGHAAGAVLC